MSPPCEGCSPPPLPGLGGRRGAGSPSRNTWVRGVLEVSEGGCRDITLAQAPSVVPLSRGRYGPVFLRSPPAGAHRESPSIHAARQSDSAGKTLLFYHSFRHLLGQVPHPVLQVQPVACVESLPLRRHVNEGEGGVLDIKCSQWWLVLN